MLTFNANGGSQSGIGAFRVRVWLSSPAPREGSRFASNIFAKNQDTDMGAFALGMITLALIIFVYWAFSEPMKS